MSAGGIDNAAAAKLRHVIGRVERIDEQIAGLNEDKSEVYQEAKSFGLDVKALKALVAKRRKVSKDPAAFTELEAVVELYEAALESRPSRARTRETPHDPITGEITDPVEVRTVDGIAKAETSAVEGAHEAPGAPLPLPAEPAPHTIERSGPLRIPEEPPSPSEPRSLTAGPPVPNRPSACANPAAGQVTSGQSGMTASTPYRVTDPAPAPSAPDPDLSPLIADAAARQEAARRLLQGGVAE